MPRPQETHADAECDHPVDRPAVPRPARCHRDRRHRHAGRRPARGPGTGLVPARRAAGTGGRRRRAGAISRGILRDAHPPRSRRRHGHARARAPALSRCTSTSGARRTSSTRRSSWRARHASTARTWTGCGASSPRCPRPTWSSSRAVRRCRSAVIPSTWPTRRATPGTTWPTTTRSRASSSPATRAASASGPTRTCCRRRRRRTSTSTAWRASVAQFRRWQPTGIFVTHFGLHTDADAHLTMLAEELDAWERVSRDLIDIDDGRRRGRRVSSKACWRASASGRVRRRPRPTRQAVPLEHCWMGLERYWKKRLERNGAS